MSERLRLIHIDDESDILQFYRLLLRPYVDVVGQAQTVEDGKKLIKNAAALGATVLMTDAHVDRASDGKAEDAIELIDESFKDENSTIVTRIVLSADDLTQVEALNRPDVHQFRKIIDNPLLKQLFTDLSIKKAS